MRILITLIVISAIVCSCKKEKEEITQEPEGIESKYFEKNKSIDTTHQILSDSSERIILRVVDSCNLVFTFNEGFGMDDNVFDNEKWHSIVFEIDSSLTEFSYSLPDFSSINCFYSKSGAWDIYECYYPLGGTIEGNKTNDTTWNIEIDVTIKENNPINKTRLYEKGSFVLSEIE